MLNTDIDFMIKKNMREKILMTAFMRIIFFSKIILMIMYFLLFFKIIIMIIIIYLMTVAPQKTEELPDQTIPACTIVSNFTFVLIFKPAQIVFLVNFIFSKQ